jgi:hypothetical protein
MVKPTVVWLGVCALLLGVACSFSADGLDTQGSASANGPQDSQASGGTPSSGNSPSGSAPAGVMRVHDVEANHLSVGVLFAHSVRAKEGAVGSAGPALSVADLATQIGTQDLEVPDLSAETLYAHDVDVKALIVRELHVSDVQIGGHESNEQNQ